MKTAIFHKKFGRFGGGKHPKCKKIIILIVGGWYCLCRKYVPSFKRIGGMVFKWQ